MERMLVSVGMTFLHWRTLKSLSLSCPSGYVSFPDHSTCTSEALWSPDLSQLECIRTVEKNATGLYCEWLSSMKGVYRILNQTQDINNNYSTVGSVIEFQCIHTPYQIDPLFTTQCQAGQWDPHPRDVCGQDFTTVFGDAGCYA